MGVPVTIVGHSLATPYWNRVNWSVKTGTPAFTLYNAILRIARNFLETRENIKISTHPFYVELHQCPSHHSILLTQGRIWEIFAKNFWELAILKNELFLSRPFWIFFSKKIIFFCFIPMKISPNLYGRMDGSKFWCFPWFPEKSLLCVKLCYTVYLIKRRQGVVGSLRQHSLLTALNVDP